jgi:hypothetical protein
MKVRKPKMQFNLFIIYVLPVICAFTYYSREMGIGEYWIHCFKNSYYNGIYR